MASKSTKSADGKEAPAETGRTAPGKKAPASAEAPPPRAEQGSGRVDLGADSIARSRMMQRKALAKLDMLSSGEVRVREVEATPLQGPVRLPKKLPQRTPFEVHELLGSFEDVRTSLAELLEKVNRLWRRRQWMAVALGAALVIVAFLFLFRSAYWVGAGCLAVSVASGMYALNSGRFLEIEVETLTLVMDLLAALDGRLDKRGPATAMVDLRSAVHASKAQAGSRAGANVVDEWFRLTLPLENGLGLELKLTEHLHSGRDEEVGRRVGREYVVGVFAAPQCQAVGLVECVTSHVSGPSGTSVSSRVREAVDIFEAALEQLLETHGHDPMAVESIDVLSTDALDAVGGG